jgi:hypothetical protein
MLTPFVRGYLAPNEVPINARSNHVFVEMQRSAIGARHRRDLAMWGEIQ